MVTEGIQRGTVPHTVLLYTVSEPGEWTVDDIVEDLPGADPGAVRRAAQGLFSEGYIHINSADQRLWPRRTGRALLRPPARAS